MKRILLLLVTALFISGIAFGQAQPAQPAIPGLPGTNGTHRTAFDTADDLFDVFNAVPTTSTEARYSAGIFTSDVDNYIDVNAYDPSIGTFFFLGGFPQTANVNTTDYLGSEIGISNTQNRISFGFATSFGANYIGLYYGGNIVNSTRQVTGVVKGSDGKAQTFERVDVNNIWRNNIAVLFGTPAFGAFRLDFILDTDSESDTLDKDVWDDDKTRTGPSVAVTWGGMEIAGLTPYVTLGFRFNDKTEIGSKQFDFPVDGENKAVSYTITENGYFGVQAGASYDLNDTALVFGELSFINRFAKTYAGDIKDAESSPAESGWKEGGGFGFGFRAGYYQALTFGPVSVGFEPVVGVGLYRTSGNTTWSNPNNADDPLAENKPSENLYNVNLGVSLGVRYAHTEKLAFYTGAKLNIIDWFSVSWSGGKNPTDDKARRVTGINWEGTQWGSTGTGTTTGGTPQAASALGFGMTLAPADGFSVGFGLNTFLDKFVLVNLSQMTVESGSFWDDTGSTGTQNVGAWFGKIFDDIRLDLTVSFKY